MNETLNNILKFINDNTYLLIGICVFLILVLIGYLIDNSIKSKKVRKDVKNETMVKEAQSNSAVNNISIDKKEDIMTKPFEEKTEDLIIDDNINKIAQPVEPEKVNSTPNEVKDEITEPINFNFDLDSIKTKQENIEPKTEESKILDNNFVNDNGEITGPISFDLDSKNESINNIEQSEVLSNDTPIIGINDLNSADKTSANNEVSIEEPKVDNINIPDEITEPINFNFDLDNIKTKQENIEPKTEESKILDNNFVNDNGEITGPISFDLDSKNESINNIEQSEVLSNDTPIIGINDLNSINTKPEEKVNDLSSSLVEPVPIVESKDPDAEIMKNAENKNSYSNSKSLLEILSDADKSKPSTNVKMDNKEESENIFSNKPNIEVNTNVQKEKVEIEPKYSSDDELDKIMKKLSSMSNDEEDNYTNIF